MKASLYNTVPRYGYCTSVSFLTQKTCQTSEMSTEKFALLRKRVAKRVPGSRFPSKMLNTAATGVSKCLLSD